MSKAEDYIEEETAKFTIDTFDGQEDSTYKYIHIDKAKEIALEAVRIAREEERATKDKWLREQLKIKIPFIKEQAREEEQKRMHEEDYYKKSIKSRIKFVEVRVREETARNLIAEIRAGSYPKNINDKTVILAITDEMLNIILRRYLVKTEVQKE